MLKDFFVLLLITHVLCDFYFQSPKMAKNKKEKLSWVLVHVFIYTVSSFAILIFMMPGLKCEYILSFAVGHAGIDLTKHFVSNCKYVKGSSFLEKEQNIFVVDQILHILVILILVYSVQDFRGDAICNVQVKEIFNSFGVSETVAFTWLIKILLIHKPVNLFIANVLLQYRSRKRESSNSQDKNVGRFIGTIERSIMVILISIEQYSAVGLVLTAKSIARYDKISKDQEFAEYYLLGTLLSTLCAIVVSVLF